jgi:hypothetical protein
MKSTDLHERRSEMLKRILALAVSLALVTGGLLFMPTLALAPPAQFPNWYLAEGSTAWGFGTTIVIENPNTTAVTCDVTFMTSGGPVVGAPVHCASQSITELSSDALPANQDFSTEVNCEEGLTIAVERVMTCPGPTPMVYDNTSSIGVTAPANTWYLPEGSSAWGFECWLLIQNPNDFDAHCNVTYMIEGGAPVTVPKVIPANSRRSFNMSDDIGARDASIEVQSIDFPVIPERAMYKNHKRGASESIGTTAPASDYFLAEGTTAYGFTTYVLVQNPNPTPTDVTVTYMTATGALPQPVFNMPANSRRTIRVNDVVPDMDLSTRVHGSQPIIAERAMYWDGGGGYGEAMHDSIGMPAAHQTFYLPYGPNDWRPSYADSTFTLVQNPNPVPVNIHVKYLKPDGVDNVEFNDTLPANSRKTYTLSDKMPASYDVSIVVSSTTAGRNIMVECATYFSIGGGYVGGTSTIGGYSDM